MVFVDRNIVKKKLTKLSDAEWKAFRERLKVEKVFVEYSVD